MRHALPATSLLALALFANSALAEPFEVSPRVYGSSVNRALMQIGSGLRLQFEKCETGPGAECRFSSERLTVLTLGADTPPRTDTIVIEADLFQDKADTGRLSALADCVLTVRATMMIFDPDVPAARRTRLLSDMTAEALDLGKSKGEGIDARYSLIFDEATDGRLSIAVTPMGPKAGPGQAH